MPDGPVPGTPLDPAGVGLCADCRHVRVVGNRRGSVFIRCARADVDPDFVRYPMLPRLACAGYERADPTATPAV